MMDDRDVGREGKEAFAASGATWQSSGAQGRMLLALIKLAGMCCSCGFLAGKILPKHGRRLPGSHAGQHPEKWVCYCSGLISGIESHFLNLKKSGNHLGKATIIFNDFPW